MIDGEIVLPLSVEMVESGEVDSYLKQLQGKINEFNNSSSSKISLLDEQKINRSVVAIGRYEESLKKIGSDTSASASINSTTQAIEGELGAISAIINKYPELRSALSEASVEAEQLQETLSQETDVKWVNITSVQELNDYLSQVESKIEEVQNLLANNPARGNEVFEQTASSIKETISSIDEYVIKLGELSSALAGTESEARSATAIYTGMKNHMGVFVNATEEQIATQKEVADTARLTNEFMQSEVATTSRSVRASIDEQISKLNELAKAYSEAYSSLDDKGNYRQRMSTFAAEAKKAAEAEEEEAEARNKAALAAKENEAQTKAEIKGYQAEISAVQQSTAQYYYRLRSVKMLGFVVSQTNTAMDKFGKNAASFATKALNAYLKLIPGVSSLAKALDKTHTSQKKLNKEINSTTKSHDGFNTSLKEAVTNLLKYGLGIRSLFVLFNRLRSIIRDGLKEMSLQFTDVNEKMSSVITSLNQMKAAVATVVEPILNIFAPALEKLAQILANVAYKIASFIAAITGQSYVYKATRAQTDYAASLDKTGKAAKKAKKELAGFDELNVLHTDDDSGSGSGAGGSGLGFEKVPIDPFMADLAEKFKEFLDRLLAPIKKAWEKVKAYVLRNFKYMLNQLKALGASIARDFWRVWEEEKTQKIFEDMFLILGDVELLIGNLAKKFREAWDYNENGYIILASIRDIIYEVVHHIRLATLYTAMWADRLNFIPLVSAIAKLLKDSVVPAVKKVLDLCFYLYKGFLELLKDFIENTLPTLIRALGYIIDAIGIIAENIQKALKESKKGEKILKSIESIVSIIAGAIENCAKKTKEWAKNLDFAPLTDATLNFLDKANPLIKFIANTLSKLWNDVLLPFYEYLIEDGLPKLLDTLGQIFGQFDEETGMGIDWEKLTEDMNTFMDALEPFFELAWDTIVQVIRDLGGAFDDFVNSDTLTTIVDKFKDWVENADPEDLAHKIETAVKAFVEIKGALAAISTFILPVVTGFMTLHNVINQTRMIGTVSKLTDKIAILTGTGGASGGGLSGLSSALSGLVGPILIVVGIIAVMVMAFGGLEETINAFKERISEAASFLKDTFEQSKISEGIEQLKEKFSGLSTQLEVLRPVFEVILDFLEALVELIGGTVIAVIDGLITIISGIIDNITGVIECLSGLFDLIVGFFTGDKDRMTQGLDEIVEGFGTALYGAIEAVLGIFEALGDLVASIVGSTFPEAKDAIFGFVNDTVDKVKGWKDDIVGFFQGVKQKLIGDPIVYDIRDGVIKGFGDFISNTRDKVKDWAGDIKDKFGEMKDKLGEKVSGIKDKVSSKFSEIKGKLTGDSKETVDSAAKEFSNLSGKISTNINPTAMVQAAKQLMEGFTKTITDSITALNDTLSKSIADIIKLFDSKLSRNALTNVGKTFIKGFSDTITTEWKILTATIDNDIKLLLETYKNRLNVNALSTIGRNFITGLMNGMNNVWRSLLQSTTSNINTLISLFKNSLNSSTLESVGNNLMKGLQNGINSGMNETVNTMSRASEEITRASESAFRVGSPSKVFIEIGNFLMQGLVVGINRGKSDVADVFDGILNVNTFISTLTDMRIQSVAIISQMVDEMDKAFSRLDALSSVDTMFNKLSNIKVPNIAVGGVIPSNALSTNNSNSFNEALADTIKRAIADGVSDLSYNTLRDDNDIVIQIDGYEVFRAVRNQSDRFRNSTGYGAL